MTQFKTNWEAHTMPWWKQHWDDLRPQIKWEVGKWFVVKLLGGGAAMAGMVALIQRILNLPVSILGALLVFVAAVFVLAMLAAINKVSTPAKSLSPQAAGPAVEQSLTPQQFQNVEDFYKTYDNQLLLETEAEIRREAAKFQAGQDREKFLVRFFASTLLMGIFEYVWAIVFRSQLTAA